MQQPDKAQFKQAMKEEVESFDENNNWKLLHRSKLPQGATVLPAIWQMKRKRRIATQEIYKWKACLNLDGSKQIKGVNYWETYAPVPSWPTVCLLLTMAIIQVDGCILGTTDPTYRQEWTYLYFSSRCRSLLIGS